MSQVTLKQIAPEDHETLLTEFEAATLEAFGSPIVPDFERNVDDQGNPIYRNHHSEAAEDNINACFIGFCIAKGFVGKMSE